MPDSNNSLLTFGPYKVLEKLGSGSFATVYRCEHMLTHRKFAGKFYDIDFAISDIGYTMVRKEVFILKLLRGRRVINFQEVVYSRSGILIVIDLVEGRTLLNVIPSRGGIPESFARPVFKQILEALRFLHCNGIVHRDVKLENIMIQKDGNIKLIDFGLADYVPEVARTAGLLVRNRCGSPHYYAPEVILGISHERFQGDKVDIWAAGVLLYSLVTGFHPFHTEDDGDDALFEQITRVEIMYDSDFSRELEHLLRKIFVKDPASRASLQRLLDHPWTNNTSLAGLPDLRIEPKDTESSSSTARLLEYWSLSEQPQQILCLDDKDTSSRYSETTSGGRFATHTVAKTSTFSHSSRTMPTDPLYMAQRVESNLRKEVSCKPPTAKSTTQDGSVQKVSKSGNVLRIKRKWQYLKGIFKEVFGKDCSNSCEDRAPTGPEYGTQTSSGRDKNRPPSLSSIENGGCLRDSLQDFYFEGRYEDMEANTTTGPYCKISFLCWSNMSKH